MKNLAFWIGAAALICGVVAIASGTGDEGRMPDLDGAVAWLNSTPLSSKSLRGKVVLVNFWTYSCINSLRELPYIKAWAAKYKDAGLVVIGVHAPEFGFEKDPANVKNAVSDLKVAFPVPIDSDHSIWSAFRNEYWPADYFIDRKGRIRYHHFGEGEYEKSERVIQELLRENGAAGLNDEPCSHNRRGSRGAPERGCAVARNLRRLRSRRELRVAASGWRDDSRKTYSPPARPALNQWGFGGSVERRRREQRARIGTRQDCVPVPRRDLHMVLGPAKNGTPVRFKVTLDGAAPVTITESIPAPTVPAKFESPGCISSSGRRDESQDRTFEIEFLDPGVEVFSFTFG